jgi:hypothetical protein
MPWTHKTSSISLFLTHTHIVTLYRSLLLQLLRAEDSHAGPGRQLPTMRAPSHSLNPVSRGCGDEPHSKGMQTSCLSPSLSSGPRAPGLQRFSILILPCSTPSHHTVMLYPEQYRSKVSKCVYCGLTSALQTHFITDTFPLALHI